MKTFELAPGVSIPTLGLGTWQLTGEKCIAAVVDAVDIGYRHIDTADRYGNHREVGEGIRRAGQKREELFVTTKLPPDGLTKSAVASNCERYLSELQIDYIDLLLIHWPNRAVPIAETLGAMDELKKQGSVRALGVSNFTINHLRDALATKIPFVMNQVELRPRFNQSELREFCKSNGITVTAYSPLGRGADLGLPLIQELAKKYGVPETQIILNWVMSRGMVVIPKASSRAHLEENFGAAVLEMEEADLARIDTLPQEDRLISPSFGDFEY